MASQEPFLINPPRRRRRRGRGRRKHRTMGLGPVGSIHRPVVRTVRYRGRKRWQTSSRARYAGKGRFVNPNLAIVGNPCDMYGDMDENPRRRRRRRNPVQTLGGFTDVIQRTLPLAVTGIASSVTTNMVPGFLGLVNPWAIHGVKTATAVFGGQMIGNVVGRDHGDIWTVVGISVVVSDLIKQFIPGVIPGLGYADYHDEWGYGKEGVTAFPEESTIQAYPEEMSGDPWPYSGAHTYGGY